MMRKKTSRARKVWIFKRLLKKNGCKGIRLEKDFLKDKGNRIDFFRVVLYMNDGKTFMLMVENHNFKRIVHESPTILYRYNIFYADVLDEILKAMKKNDSNCLMCENSFPMHPECFLKKDVSLEMLEIEFDLTYLDFFRCNKKR